MAVKARKSLVISVTSVMAAISAMLAAAKVEVPFPILTYLKVDFAEIPVLACYVLVGLWGGLSCATIHWLFLLIRAGEPLGPTMKLLATSSMMLGAEAARRATGRLGPLAYATAAATRVAVMTVANLAVLAFLFPQWLAFAQALLSHAGLPVHSRCDALVWTCAITGVYNALHTCVSALGAELVVKTVKQFWGGVFK